MNINLKLVKSSLDSIREDYTALVIANGKTTQEDLIAAVNKAEPHISKISAEQVLATQLAFIGAMLAEGNYVNMGGIGLSPMVEGSLLHADEDVTSDKLGIQVNVYDSVYLEAIKSLEVTTTVDEDSLPFNFTKVEDSATADFGTATPGCEFMPIGDKLSQGLDGERIEITDKVGTTKVITDATGSSNGMWLKATCPRGLAQGKGKIAVYSRGLKTPEGDVDHITRSITIRQANIEPGPHIESLKSRATRGEGEWRVFADVFDITGYGFDEDTTATLRLVKRATGQEAAKVNSQTSGYNVLKRESDEKLVFTIDRNSSAEPDGSWLDDVTYDAELVLTNAKGTTRLTLTRIED